MKHSGDVMLLIVTVLLLFGLHYTYTFNPFKEIVISTSANKVETIRPASNLQKSPISEKRGTPTYDYIIGSDKLPHFRVFFWIPKDAKHLTPYADAGIITDVSEHGPIEKWSVVTTDKINKDEKLVFIYVPKTFIFFHASSFEKVIHLKYN